MAVTKLCTYIETLFTDVGYIFTNVSNGCDKNWIRELIKMSQTLLMFSLMLQPLLIQYVSNGCDKIAVTLMPSMEETTAQVSFPHFCQGFLTWVNHPKQSFWSFHAIKQLDFELERKWRRRQWVHLLPPIFSWIIHLSEKTLCSK